jgi:hypothetical protein
MAAYDFLEKEDIFIPETTKQAKIAGTDYDCIPSRYRDRISIDEHAITADPSQFLRFWKADLATIPEYGTQLEYKGSTWVVSSSPDLGASEKMVVVEIKEV